MNAATYTDRSRREFLKNAGRVAATSTLPSAASYPVHAAEDRTVRVALVGCVPHWLCAVAQMAIFASFLSAAEPRVLISNATDGEATWRYTTDAPSDAWASPGFDDSKWERGKAGFGVTDHVTPPATVGTPWTTREIWLRKTIDVPAPLEFQLAAIIVHHDEDVQMFVNGKLVFAIEGYNTKWIAYDVSQELRNTLTEGKNQIAVHVSQTTGGQYIDVGLVLDPQQPLILPVAPMELAELKRLRDARWPEQKAWAWYAEVGPVAGCNYLPRTAVNMTEMWQKETFDPQTIDEELGWAAAAGYNSLRVFVQYLVWKDDPEGLKLRMEQFLDIAHKHGMRVMLIPFCDCAFAGREPYLGKQDEPVPGVHNSGWVPSPGLKRVVDRSTWPDLERYIKDLVQQLRQGSPRTDLGSLQRTGPIGLGREESAACGCRVPLVTRGRSKPAADGWSLDRFRESHVKGPDGDVRRGLVPRVRHARRHRE